MSSDTFDIRVRAIEGDTVELLCTTSTAGGVNDYAITRSFALMAIEDGMPYPGETMTPLQRAMREVGGPTPPVWQEQFHRDHVGKFIASTELVERIGIVTDEAAWQAGRFHDAPSRDTAKQFPLHQFVLRVRATDPRWLEGLTVGQNHGTTAFDAWWNDPLRPTAAQQAAVDAKASYWYPPGQEAASETAGKKSSGKKTSSRTASKKTAAKKSASKTASGKKSSKAASKKTPAKKSSKAASKKTPAKKSSKAASKKTPAKKSSKAASKKSPAKKSSKAASKKSPAKKSSKAASKKTPAKKSSKAASKKAPGK